MGSSIWLEIIKSLSSNQIWSILVFLQLGLAYLIIVITNAIRNNGAKFGKWEIQPKFKDKEKLIPSYLKTQTWEKQIRVKSPQDDTIQVLIGSIGFIKDVVIFKFFGEFWNSASPEGQEGYNLFESEFIPPLFLSEENRKEMECFVFVENCNLQTKLFAIIRQKSKNWKKVFIVASKSQIDGQELESLLPENGGSENIVILQMPIKFTNEN
jgi:hypothetical protein